MSSRVTKCFFLLIVLHKKELQHCACSHSVHLIKMHRRIYILNLRSCKGHVTCHLMTELN